MPSPPRAEEAEAPPAPPKAPPANGTGSGSAAERLLARLRAGALAPRRGRVPRDYWAIRRLYPWLPTHPLIGIEPPTQPAPPRLDASLSDRDLARQLAVLVQAYYQRVTGRAVWGLIRPGLPIERSRWYGALVQTARKLIECDLQPVVWLRFCRSFWQQYRGHEEGLPQLGFVLSARNVDRWDGWAKEDHGTVVPRPRRSAEYEQLGDRFAMLQMAVNNLDWRGEISEATLRAAVAQHLPAECVAELQQRVRQQAAEAQVFYQTAMRRGLWVWDED